MAEAAKLQIVIEAKDQTKGAFSSVNSEITKFGASAGKVGGALNTMATAVVATAAVVGGGLVAGLAGAVKTSTDFSHAMSEVSAAVDDGGASMQQLSGLALDLGKDTQLAGVDATEAAAAIAELARGGVSVGDLMGGAAKGGLLLFSAGASSVEAATGVAVKAMTTFNLTGAEVPHIADLIAAGANKSATSVDELGQAFNQSASVAANAGLSIETLTGTLAFLAQRGIEGSDAGTSLKTALLALQAPTDVAATTMKELGINVRDAQGNMLPFADIAQILQDKLGGLSAAQRDAALKTIFGNDAIRVGIALMEGGGSAITDWTAKVNDAGYAARIGATKNNDLFGSFEQLKATIQTAAIEVGQRLEPALRRLTDAGSDLINNFLKNPAVQAGLDKFAANASKAIDDIVTKLKDPAFQQQMKDWAQAALDTGRAIADLAGTLKDVLGPPLQAAVGWFNDLDASGKKNVVTFGLLTVAAIKLVGPITSLVSVMGELYTAGAAIAPILLAIATSPFVAAIAAGGAAVAAATVVVAGAVAVGTKYRDLTGETTKIAHDNAVAWDAAAFAIEHGATATGTAIGQFEQYIQANRITITSTEDLVNAWNGFLGMLQANQLGIQGLTRAQTTLQAGLDGTNRVLGEGMLGGLGYSQVIGGMTTSANALAGAMNATVAPFEAAQAGMAAYALALQDTNGVLTPLQEAAGQANLHIAELNVQLQNAVGATNAAAMAMAIAEQDTGEFGTQVGLLRNQVLGLTQSYLDHNAALAGLNSENGRLGGYLQTLQAQWDALNKATDNGKNVTAEQRAEYERLAPAIQYLNATMGTNEQGIVSNTLALVDLDQKLKAAGVSMGTASDVAMKAYSTALAQGKSDAEALTIAIQAAGGSAATAGGKIDGTGVAAAASAVKMATGAIAAKKLELGMKDIPGTVQTTVTTPGLDDATIGVRLLQTAINDVPPSFTVTATVDISGALASIDTLNNNMPHSPAKEGPFRTLPNWQALFESWGPALDAAITQFEAWGNDVAKKGAETVSSVSKAITDALGASTLLAKVDVSAGPTGDQIGWFAHLADSLISALASIAARFDTEGLKAVGDISDTLGKMGSGIKGALDGLGALASYDFAALSPNGETLGWFGHLMSSLIITLQNVATEVGSDGIAAAKEVAEGASSIGSAVKSTLEGLKALAEYDFTKGSPDGSAMGWFTFLMRSLVQNFAEAAQTVGSEGMAQATVFAQSVADVVAAGKAALDLFTQLIEFKDKPTEALQAVWKGLEGALSAMGDLVARSDALKNAAHDYLANMQEAARLVLQAQSIGNGMGATAPTLVLAPSGFGSGGGWDSSKGGGGGGSAERPVVVNMYGNAYGFSDFNDAVVGAVDQGTRQGRFD